jgi:GR25 family glycosyltransferase involved in LPS biosynthesis
MINKYFDSVFLINLKKRKDRLSEFDELSKKYNFKYEIFEAFDGNQNIDDNFHYNNIKITNQYGDARYFKSQIGCLISHLEILKICKNKNYKSSLILEDDVNFCDNFEEKFINLFDNIPNDWQLLYLGGNKPNFLENFNYCSLANNIHTTHSYAIKYEVLDLIINYFENNIFNKPIDCLYADIQNNIKTYIAKPYLTYQRQSYSDIASIIVDYTSTKEYL